MGFHSDLALNYNSPLQQDNVALVCVSEGCFEFDSYLAQSCFLAELGDGLIELRLLLREVLLVESEQLLALFVLLLHVCETRGQGNCTVSR